MSNVMSEKMSNVMSEKYSKLRKNVRNESH